MTNQSYDLNKDEFYNIRKSQGLAAALRMETLEHESVEGAQGYNPQLVKKLETYRQFSIELWEMRNQFPE
jgi:hypothetical protein